MAAMAGAVVLTVVAVRDGISHRREGLVLLVFYALIVGGILLTGAR
jgi:Ca2+/H+ antiporter